MSYAPKGKAKKGKKEKQYNNEKNSYDKPAVDNKKYNNNNDHKDNNNNNDNVKDQGQFQRGTGRRKSQLAKEEIESLRKAFDFLDEDGSGTIEPEEIAGKLAKFGLHLTGDEINDIMADLDENGDGVMDFSEFVTLMDRRMSINSQRNEMRETFKVFDKNGDGMVCFNDLKKTLLQLGEDVTDADVKDMIKQADLNGDGKIDFNEFVIMMSANETEETKNNLLGISA